MPSSLKFTAGLLVAGVFVALASAIVQYRESRTETRQAAEALTGGRIDEGREAIARRGCGACHFIPGVTGATGRVGPSLRGVARRAFIAGRLPNDPGNLGRWILQPEHLSPGTAMPEQPISPPEARDISAYLYTLR